MIFARLKLTFLHW